MYAPGMGYPGLYAFDEESPEPVAPDFPYMVAIDWDGDGVFEGGNENITAYVRRGATFRGKDDPSNLVGVSVAGAFSVDLLNNDGRFSKFNSGSPYYGDIKPGRRIGFWITAPISKCLWTGELDDVKPSVSQGSLPRAQLSALGVLANLVGDKAQISPPALEDTTTGAVIDQVLDTMGFPAASRDIDDGTVPVSRWYPSENEALGLLREMEEQEGGELYEGLNWDIVFRDRYDRLLNHASSVATFADDGVELGYRAIDQGDPRKNVFNYFEATLTPPTVEAEQIVWSLEEPIVLAPGETRVYFVSLPSGMAYSHEWTSIDAVRDYTASRFFPIDPDVPEEWGDITIDSTPLAKALRLELTNGGASASTFTAIDVYAVPVTTGQPYKISKQDSDSIVEFGRLRYPFTSRWLPNSAYAESSMAYELARHKDEHPLITKTIVASSPELLEQCVSRDIGDRVTIEATSAQTQLGIDQDFYIESISHSFGAGMLLRTTFTLSPVIDVYDGEDVFIIDTSELDGPEVLAL